MPHSSIIKLHRLRHSGLRLQHSVRQLLSNMWRVHRNPRRQLGSQVMPETGCDSTKICLHQSRTVRCRMILRFGAFRLDSSRF